MWFASLIFFIFVLCNKLKTNEKIKILSLFVCLIALLAACEDEDITPSYGARTVLVYIAGNNSLGQSDFDSKDVSEMIEGMKGTEGTTNNLLVYFAGYKKTAKLIRLIKNGKGEVKQETVMSYDKHNSVSLDVMKDVLERHSLIIRLRVMELFLVSWRWVAALSEPLNSLVGTGYKRWRLSNEYFGFARGIVCCSSF